MGITFTKLKLFFHNVSFNINTLFPPLPEMVYASYVKPFAEALELFRHAVFQLIIQKTTSSDCIFLGTEQMKSQGAKVEL
jgi:hypothetical protein